MMAENTWTYTEIGPSVCTVSNGDLTVSIRSDFSGDMTSEAGDFFEFNDLRTLIDGAKMLEQVFTDHYGGYK